MSTYGSRPEPNSVEPEMEVPPAWRGSSGVLYIAGRGPLDEAAAAMLVQLVGKHGTGARLVAYIEISRERIQTLDVDGVAMACVSYLDISGSPAQLCYLMQRLRQRLPDGAPILVGLWPTQDATLKDNQVQRSIGADYFTSLLEETVTSCVEAERNSASPAELRPQPETSDPAPFQFI